MLQNGAGLVLTGGGAKLRNIVELCQFDLGLNTRIGIPGIGFSDSLSNELKQPQFSTALGLLKYGIEEETKDIHIEEEPKKNYKTYEETKETDNNDVEDSEHKGRKFIETFKSTLTKLFEQIS